MKTLLSFCLASFILFSTHCLGEDSPQGADAEAELIRQFQSLWEREDHDQLPFVIDKLGRTGGTNALEVLLQHLDYNPAVARARQISPTFIVEMRGNRYVAADAIQKIGIPLDRCLTELENSDAGSMSENLLADIGIACHGQDFCTNLISRAHESGGRWLHVEHLCIPRKICATNNWPVSVSMSRTNSGLAVTVTNYLASSFPIINPPLTKFGNTLHVHTDSACPRVYFQSGTDVNIAHFRDPANWYCSIPAGQAHTFFVSWDSIENLYPADILDSAWRIQWSFRDDLNHEFLSNPIEITPQGGLIPEHP